MVKRSWLTSVTQFTTDAREGDVGQLRVEGNKIYRYVQNKHSSALSVGFVVVGSTADTSEGLVYQFGASNTISSLLVGVAVSAIPVDGYGWVQCSGYCATVNVEGTTTDILVGDSLLPITGQNYVKKSSATTSPPGGHIVALAGFTTDATGQIAGKICNCI